MGQSLILIYFKTAKENEEKMKLKFIHGSKHKMFYLIKIKRIRISKYPTKHLQYQSFFKINSYLQPSSILVTWSL